MNQSGSKFGRRLCLSASVLAIVTAGAAMAQTTVLTSSSANYDMVANSGVDKFVELSSGTNAMLTFSSGGTPKAPLPAGMVGLLVNDGWPNGIGSTGGWDLSWWEVTTNAPVIKVDAGATLTIAGNEQYSGADYNFESMFQATGDVVFQSGEFRLWKANTFLGNVTLANGTILDLGSREWGCCTFAGTVTFGSNTNIDMNGGRINFYQSATPAVVGGRISGSATADIEVNSSTLVVNGNYGSSGKSFAGTVNIASDATFTVGDSTHKSAVFGGTGAVINLNGASAVLSGYGTINGTVNSSGIIKAGGTKDVMGGLAINGALNLTNSSQVYTYISPSGVSGLTITGNANLAGEMILNIAEGTYGNSVFPLVAVSGGSLTGSFGTISTAGNVAGAMVGLMQTSTGYSIVTEKGSAAQVFGHLVYANRVALSNFVGSLYDAMATTPATGAKIDTFVTPYGSIENVGRDGLGYEEKAYGLTVGGMHRFAAHGGVVGAAFSYRHGNMSVKDDPATASTNSYNLAVYGGADVNLLRIDGSVFYSLYDADTKRPMSTFGTSVAGQKGFAWGFSGQLGRPMFESRLMPYVRATYARIHLNGASESGSPQFDLRHDAINQNTFMVDLGLRFQLIRPEGERHWRLDADIAARHDLSDPGETISGGFANFASGTSVSYWRGDSKNTLRLGLNANDQITDRLELYARLDGALTSHRRAGELTAGVKYKF